MQALAGKLGLDGSIELRKRAKLRAGQQVRYGGEIVDLMPESIPEGA